MDKSWFKLKRSSARMSKPPNLHNTKSMSFFKEKVPLLVLGSLFVLLTTTTIWSLTTISSHVPLFSHRSTLASTCPPVLNYAADQRSTLVSKRPPVLNCTCDQRPNLAKKCPPVLNCTVNQRHTLATKCPPVLNCTVGPHNINRRVDPLNQTFYDDPNLNYSIGSSITKWDEKRREWLRHHPSYAAGARDRVLVLTGSQSTACPNPVGDFFLLRLFKNKVDYCRIHGYDIFYNMAYLYPKMDSYWAKTPIIRAAMLAHPEAEWIWWIDSDAIFTDMDFTLPLDKYKNHNLVVDGWPGMIYERRSWLGVNAGVLLFRNCQWSMDFMNAWASMGPGSSNYEKWGRILKKTFTDKRHAVADDQSALIYMLLKQKKKWAKKVYIENEYCFQSYWANEVNGLENLTQKYVKIEKNVSVLRRRHAEAVSERYGVMWDKYLKEVGYGKGTGRRPFITHFTGCSPCSGAHNPMYVGDSCRDGMEIALNFADNQVLRNFGFGHPNLLDSSSVLPWQFDAPSL